MQNTGTPATHGSVCSYTEPSVLPVAVVPMRSDSDSRIPALTTAKGSNL